MLFEDFQKVYGSESHDTELVAVAVRESVNARNRFIWISIKVFLKKKSFILIHINLFLVLTDSLTATATSSISWLSYNIHAKIVGFV